MKTQITFLSVLGIVFFCSVACAEFVVIDEAHIFVDPLQVILENKFIDPASIVVSDSTGLAIYTENDDYTIAQINDWTELHPTPFGVDLPNITDGQTLLVDYVFIPEPTALSLLLFPLFIFFRKRKK